jgi:hypothetical protein
MGNKEIHITCYADDAVLTTDNEDNLQSFLHQFLLSYQKYNTKIAIIKTKALTVCERPLRCKLEVQVRVVEEIMSFKYLAPEITSNGALQSKASSIKSC